MSRIGVDNLHVAKIETDTPEATTYAEAVRMPKLINVGLSKAVAEAELHADDALDEYIAELTGLEISINSKDLTAEQEALLLGKKIDTNGAVVSSETDNAPYFAVMFRSRKSDGTYQYRVLYKVRFRPYDETYDTKSDSITFQTPTITGRALKRDSDGLFDLKVDETEENKAKLATFFTEPMAPTFI